MARRGFGAFVQHLASWWTPETHAPRSTAPLASSPARSRPLGEAVGAYAADVDANLPGNQNQALYRSVGGGNSASGNDYSAIEYRTLLRLVRRAYALNGVPANLIDVGVDFVVGEGFAPKALASKGAQEMTTEEEDFGEMLTSWWTDPRNALDDEHDAMVTTLFNEGNLLLTVRAINPDDGFVLLGHEPNDLIERIITGPNGVPIIALLTDPTQSTAQLRRFYLLNSSDPDVDEFEFMAGPGQAAAKAAPVIVRRNRINRDGSTTIVQEAYDGIAFYASDGRVFGATLGKPRLGRIIDLANIHDEIVWGFAERMKALHRYLMHAVFTGVQSQADIDALMASTGLNKAPETGQTIGTNESVALNIISPGLSSQPVTDMERTMRMLMAGSFGFPESWTGSDQDANRATILGKNTVTFKRLRRSQKKVIRFFTMIGDFQIAQWRNAGVLAANFDARYEMTRSSLDDKDRANEFAAISSFVTALNAAVGVEMLPAGLGKKLLVEVLREAGFDISEADMKGDDLEGDVGPAAALIAKLREIRAQQAQGRAEEEGNNAGQV